MIGDLHLHSGIINEESEKMSFSEDFKRNRLNLELRLGDQNHAHRRNFLRRFFAFFLIFPCFTTEPLCLVAYNVHHGERRDGKIDLERIAKVIAAEKPDLVALQEGDENWQRSGSVDQAAELGKLLKMEHRFGKFMDFQGGRYGLAVLLAGDFNAVP